MLKYGGKGVSARPSSFGTWPIDDPIFLGPCSCLHGGAVRTVYLCCRGFLEIFARCALGSLVPPTGSAGLACGI